MQHGSSPRGRGTQLQSGASFGPGRFIPARAGNTTRRALPSLAAPVHPRAGGEHPSSPSTSISRAGSSPRGRGTHVAVRARGCVATAQRFIPARAGNTPTRPGRSAGPAVHPRAGGEHSRRTVTPTAIFGSSPRGRGTLATSTGPECVRRFIPARAGNTRHRGTPAPRLERQRFIPARAGNTMFAMTVHPRAGGEHGSSPNTAYSTDRPPVCTGSSPRGRGTHAHAARFIPARAGNTCTSPSGGSFWRFIPARAGNTCRPRRAPRAVHPRAGGEHSCHSGGYATQQTPVHPRAGGEHRFIPARAGNTAGMAHVVARPVHPRAGGEHSSRNRLIQRIYFDDKERTRIGATGLRERRGGSRPRNRIWILQFVATGQG